MAKFKESIKSFFKRDVLSHPEDIARPYDKIITYILKAIGITLFVFGIVFFMKAGNSYVIYKEIVKTEYPFIQSKFNVFGADAGEIALNKTVTLTNSPISSILIGLEQDELEKLKADLVSLIIVFSLISFGFFLAGLFIGSVIILRYIARVLPDRIYFRFDAERKSDKLAKKIR